MRNNQTTPIAGFQWLRVFAAFGVVGIHVSATHWYALSLDSSAWQALTVWNGLVRWPVPVFLMITGALFLPRVTPLKSLLTRYIPRIVLAFFLWSCVYALWAIYQGATGREALLKLVTGEYHLWYLPFLCGVYLVMPFVQKIVTDARLEEQLLAVSILIGLAIPWLADLGADLWPSRGDLIRAMENNLNYTFFFDLLAYFLLGHWLHTRTMPPARRRLLYALGLLSVLLNGPMTIWFSRRIGSPSSLFFDHASPTTFFAAAALFVFAKYNLTKLPRVVDLMARLSFGVYLSHVLVLHILVEQGIHTQSLHPAWSVPLLSAAVFAISLALTAVLSFIPGLGKTIT